jgi:hypothetical protein
VFGEEFKQGSTTDIDATMLPEPLGQLLFGVVPGVMITSVIHLRNGGVECVPYRQGETLVAG